MKILDGKVYKDWHQIYVRASNEKALVIKTLKNIFAGMSSRKTFLDVGPGDGALTLLVKPFFDTTVVVEPNKCVEGAFRRNGMKFINKNFEDAALGDKKFDFILCSHVFWLIKKEKQAAFIKKMYARLNKKGKMAIIMMAPIGQCHNFHSKFFYNYDTTSYEILKTLRFLRLPAMVYPVEVKFQTRRLNNFLSICKLFTLQSWLHPVNVSQKKLNKELGDLEKYTETKVIEIKNYAKTFCLKENDTYAMDMAVDILVVEK